MDRHQKIESDYGQKKSNGIATKLEGSTKNKFNL